MRPKRLGLFLVVCAPSGTGKSTLSRRLCAEFPNLSFSISATTRPPRVGEVNGRDYHFLTPETFAAWRDGGRLAEWAAVYGHLYGTPARAVCASPWPTAGTCCSTSTSRARPSCAKVSDREPTCSSCRRRGRNFPGASRPGGRIPRKWWPNG